MLLIHKNEKKESSEHQIDNNAGKGTKTFSFVSVSGQMTGKLIINCADI